LQNSQNRVLMASNSHVALRRRYPQGHWLDAGPVLTNRMSELLTYGSVGGAGGNPGPYPAPNAGIASELTIGRDWPGVGEPGRWAEMM
jgi:hypothetical protein